MLAPALRGHVAGRALENFKQGLLHAFAGDIAGDADIIRLASDFIDLVDVNDADLSALHVVVRGLEQPQNNVLHVFTDVTRLGQGGGIGHAERHVDDARQRAGQEGFPGAGRADEEDVALLQFDVLAAGQGNLAGGGLMQDALVVVVDRHGERFLGQFLADDKLVELGFDLRRLGHAHRAVLFLRLLFEFFVEDALTKGDATVADVNAGAGDEFADLAMALTAERAHGEIGRPGHRLKRAWRPGFPCATSPPRRPDRKLWPPWHSCSSRGPHRCAPARPACRCAAR